MLVALTSNKNTKIIVILLIIIGLILKKKIKFIILPNSQIATKSILNKFKKLT